jgi:hypothetical protein
MKTVPLESEKWYLVVLFSNPKANYSEIQKEINIIAIVD